MNILKTALLAALVACLSACGNSETEGDALSSAAAFEQANAGSRPGEIAMGDVTLPQGLPLYTGAWRVKSTDARVPVVFFTPASGHEVVNFYVDEGKRRGFQAMKSENPYPGLVLLNEREEGAVIVTVPDGRGTRFFLSDGSDMSAD